MADAQVSSKPVIVRVKRKSDQSPLQALWLEINERPPKRPLLDFQKLSISAVNPPQEELKIRRVLVQHVETLSSSQATDNFLHYFVHPTSHTDPKLEGSSKVPKRALQKESKHGQLLSKARQEHKEFAKSARFEQIWKRRGNKEAIHDDAVDEVCRVYDILRVDEEDTSMKVEQEELSAEDQESLSKFLPLLREFIPSAAEEIESDIHSHNVKQLKQDSTSEYVYDVYAVKENIDETDDDYPFPLVQVDDDDEMFYDGPDNSDYETDDSNAEANALNDYPEEESSEGEEKSERSGTESEEVESDTETRSDDSEYHDKSEDPFCEDDLDYVCNDQNHGYCDDSDDSRLADC